MDEEEDESVREIIRKQVRDWDDEEMLSARFKAFSGQRGDWEQRYYFWRDLIISIARQLRIFIIRPSQVKNIWFNRGGLTPLCLDHVLLEMYNSGDILRSSDLVDPTSGRISQIFRRVLRLVGMSKSSTIDCGTEDHLILSTLMKEKAVEVVKVLSDSHWTSSCIVTMDKFREICGGFIEASAILGYLSGCGKVNYLVINTKDFIEGVKVSLSPGAVFNATPLDYDILHLIRTQEKLQQQLDVIDQRSEMYRKLALASLKSGNKKIALRHAKELKLVSQSREKCTTFFNRVEEVLRVISDAESSQKFSEAIQIGARAIKENNMSVEEVQIWLQELEESMDSQTQVEKTLEAAPLYESIEDEDIEDELKHIELEVGRELSQVCFSKPGVDGSVEKTGGLETPESLSHALSNMNLIEGATKKSVMRDLVESSRNLSSKDLKPEAA